jgi:Alw26I/Eco31I/Esp3I family type II restriction m6 adenine DNA methyltransferase
LNKEATTLRSKKTILEVTSTSSLPDRAKHIEESIKGTLFERYTMTSDVTIDELYKFSVSSEVTKKIIDELLLKLDSLDEFFFLSKVVEQGYFKLITSPESNKLKNNLAVSKEFGVFYTPLKIAREMAEQAVLGSKSKVIIDPCAGTGNLLAACMEYAANNRIKLKRLIGIELDTFSSKVAQKALNALKSSLKLDVEIEILNADSLDIFSQQMELFANSVPTGTIIINPPYGKIKFESDKLKNQETKLDFDSMHSEKKQANFEELKIKIKKVLGSLTAGKGSLEWSKVFLSLCFNRLTDGEKLIFIGPCGWLNSVSQNDIRKAIVANKSIEKIHFLSETFTGFETVNQPIAIVTMNTSQNSEVELVNNFQDASSVDYQSLESLAHFGYPIPRITGEGLNLFIRLQSFPKFAEFTHFSNLRGEIDQSIDKSIFTREPTDLRLIRGENIGRFSELTVPEERRFFADVEAFHNKFSTKPKGKAYKKERIVCRQCSYMKQQRRLIFTLVPDNCVVGNSCNYIETPKADLYFFLGLFNSALLDWYFRVLNGNNHVANYEIDDFPIPEVSQQLKSAIDKEVRELVLLYNDSDTPISTTYTDKEAKLDSLIFQAFQLTEEEVTLVLSENHNQEYLDRILRLINNEQ